MPVGWNEKSGICNLFIGKDLRIFLWADICKGIWQYHSRLPFWHPKNNIKML
jgi:hypothetical protein